MKFSINKTELQNALSVVLKGVSTRSTLPVLSGILADVSQDTLTLQATDLELSIQFDVPALVEEPGCAVFPGKLFSDIIKNLPDAAVHIEAQEGEATLACDSSTFSIRTLSANDFPGFPKVEASQTITLPFTTFSKMVKRVCKTVSKDESRAILTGVLIETNGAQLRMVATDSYRLALTETEIDSSNYDNAEDFQAVIAGSFLQDLANLPVADESVNIGVAENQIIVKCNNMQFINRRIEGTYPNYRQLLPDTHNTRATFDVDALSSAVRRASLISSNTSPIKFSLSPEVNLVQLTVTSMDVGSVQENIDCPVEGEESEIAFNSSYVIDGLLAARTDQLYFDVQTGLKPGIFRSVDSSEYLYLIMPVRI